MKLALLSLLTTKVYTVIMELLFVAGGLLLIYFCMSELIVDVEIPLMNDFIQTPV